MKKYLFVLSLFCGLALSLASCGGDDEDDFDESGNPSSNIVDSGKYGKFEKLTINEIPVYNCIEAMISSTSTCNFLPDYLIWKNNGYENEPAVNINLDMYDAPTIEAYGLATISLYLKESAFYELKSDAVDVTSQLLSIYVSVSSKTEFSYGADYKEKFSVLSGNIKLKKKSTKKYSVTFDNFKVRIEGEEVSIKGSASFEEW